MPLGRALSWSSAHSRVSATRDTQDALPAAGPRRGDAGRSRAGRRRRSRRGCGFPFPRAISRAASTAPACRGPPSCWGAPRILAPCPRRKVGRSWPLIRFQAASRISSRNAAGQCSQWMLGLLVLGLPVSGASGQTGSRVAAVEVGVQGARQVREDDGAGRRRAAGAGRGRSPAAAVMRRGFPVSRWLTIARSALGDPGQGLGPGPSPSLLLQVFQAVVGVAPVCRPGGGRQDGPQAGQRLVQVGEAGMVTRVDACVRAGQAHQERGAAAAVRRLARGCRGCRSSPRSLSRRRRDRAGPAAGRPGPPCGHGRRRPRRRPRSPRRPRPGPAYRAGRSDGRGCPGSAGRARAGQARSPCAARAGTGCLPAPRAVAQSFAASVVMPKRNGPTARWASWSGRGRRGLRPPDDQPAGAGGQLARRWRGRSAWPPGPA